MIFNMGGFNPLAVMPDFTYSGAYTVVDDGKNGNIQNWRIKFLTSGDFVPKRKMVIDAFLVGGGGGSGSYKGSGGGYTLTQKNITLEAGELYQIVIGSGGPGKQGEYKCSIGGSTIAFGHTAYGGNQKLSAIGTKSYAAGGCGGGAYENEYAGGDGGTDGGNGKKVGSNAGGTGQGTTTREFGEPDALPYAGGGGGATAHNTVSGQGLGGYWGGGNGQAKSVAEGRNTAGLENSGGGGGGGNNYDGSGMAGGSGVVIIRNVR